ncbi:sulfite exporter TauE/SafE family protein [Streptomyces geranii]|uniref:hypothetical protein n=1 Tax=Streptomyces geranii TaxID=2058923 RepID=UPI0013003ED2|nr:hypothetical protein [Streptomyces geranii]
MNIARGIQLWVDTGPNSHSGYHSGLVRLSMGNAAQNSSGTPAWVPVVGAIAVIAVACIGWWLTRTYRREDHQREDEHRHGDHRRDDQHRHQDRQREDLAANRRLLEDADLEMRRLSRLESAAGRGDLAHLQDLQVRVERVADRGPYALKQPFGVVSGCMDAYIATAVPDVAEAMEIYCKASTPDEVPLSWSLAVLLKRAAQQGRATSALADAVMAAEQAVEALRGG